MIVCMDPQHACTVFCTVHCCSVINSWRSAARRLAPGAPCSTRPSAGPALPPRAVRRRRAGPGTARDHTADRPRTAPGRARGDRSPRERPRCGYSKREALRLPARAACVTPRLALCTYVKLPYTCRYFHCGSSFNSRHPKGFITCGALGLLPPPALRSCSLAVF